jgi:hypothetical protein
MNKSLAALVEMYFQFKLFLCLKIAPKDWVMEGLLLPSFSKNFK